LKAKDLFAKYGIERSATHITSNPQNILRVRVPNQPSRTFNPKFFKSIKETITQAIIYRDSMNRKNRSIQNKDPLYSDPVKQAFHQNGIRVSPYNIFSATENISEIDELTLRFYMDGTPLIYKVEFDELKDGTESKLYYAAYFLARLRNILEGTGRAPTPANIKNARRWAYNTKKHLLQQLTDEEYREHAAKHNQDKKENT